MISGADAITSWTAKNSRGNLFRSKQTRKVPSNIITDLKVRKNARAKFWRPKDIMKDE